jgi:hypothetical protein
VEPVALTGTAGRHEADCERAPDRPLAAAYLKDIFPDCKKGFIIRSQVLLLTLGVFCHLHRSSGLLEDLTIAGDGKLPHH